MSCCIIAGLCQAVTVTPAVASATVPGTAGYGGGAPDPITPNALPTTLVDQTIHGYYAVAGIAMRNVGFGTFDISSLPTGATVLSAGLIFDILGDNPETGGFFGASNSSGVFSGEATVVSPGLLDQGASPCWGTAGNYLFYEDLTPLNVVTGNGYYTLRLQDSGDTNGQDPWLAGSPEPMIEGASLVIIYSDPADPLTTIEWLGGADETDSDNQLQQNLSGFVASSSVSAHTTYIVADGQGAGSEASFNGQVLPNSEFMGAALLPSGVGGYGPAEPGNDYTYSGGNPGSGYYYYGNLWDDSTFNVSSLISPGATSATIGVTGLNDCLVWLGQVFAVADTSSPYVGLGDSYSSGQGTPDSTSANWYSSSLPPYVDRVVGTSPPYGNQCAQSDTSYPVYLAQAHQLPLNFLACGGATTLNVMPSPPGKPQAGTGQPTQLQAMGASPNTQLVTVTIGGNDAGFSSTLIKCALGNLLLQLGGSPAGCTASTNFTNAVQTRISNLYNDSAACSNYSSNPLCATFQAIEQQAPNASVIAAGYPALFPTQSAQQNCSVLKYLFAPADQTFFNGMAGLMDSVESDAAQYAGVNYVSVLQGFNGHAPCTPQPWLNALTFPSGGNSFHPNVTGQQQYAQAIENYIAASPSLNVNGFPTNPPPANPPPSPPDPVPSEAWDTLIAQAVPNQFNSGCQDEFQAGQQVEISGGGFVPGTTVTVTLTSPGAAPASASYGDQLATLTADQNGDIGTTVQVPFSALGFNEAPNDLVFIEATGAGSYATTEDNIAMLSLVPPTDACAVAFAPASATVSLTGNDTPFLPVGGAVFEVVGQGLPGSVVGSPLASPPAPGTFAELDTNSSGQTVCPASEPSGVTCSGGTLEDLYPGATYTVTELEAPPGYATAPVQTFTAPTDGSTAVVPFADDVLVGNFTTGSGAQNCLLCLMAASGAGELAASGTATVTWAGPATADSTSPAAITATGNAHLSGSSLFSPGGETVSGNAKVALSSPLTKGSASDPFYWFSAPAQISPTQSISLSAQQSGSASPGTYSGITVSGQAHLSLQPGLYVLTGPLTISGQATVSGTGVTFELSCAKYPAPCSSAAGVTISGNASLNLDGGATGPGQGFVFLASPGVTVPFTVSGSAQVDLTGLVYGGSLSIIASGSAVVDVQGAVVIGTLTVTGTAQFQVSEPSNPTSGGGGGGSGGAPV